MSQSPLTPVTPPVTDENAVLDGLFQSLGLSNTAYVKANVIDGESVWTIHQADGLRVGMAPSREIAFVAIRQHDMTPVSVH